MTIFVKFRHKAGREHLDRDVIYDMNADQLAGFLAGGEVEAHLMIDDENVHVFIGKVEESRFTIYADGAKLMTATAREL